MSYENVVITGTGKYIPQNVASEKHFANHHFFDAEGKEIHTSGVASARKLESITGIQERKYAQQDTNTSHLAGHAAKQAIQSAGIDPEFLDQIIVGQNFGDVSSGSIQSDMVPSIASRVKHQLQIVNPNCVAYDVIFGCPGWIQGVIQAYTNMKAGFSKSALIIGAETLSRVVDHHDRDSMIYADGAGAIVLEKKEEQSKRGILSFGSQSFTKEEAYFLYYGKSFHPDKEDDHLYIKMNGRKIYEFALTNVPVAMKHVFDQSGFSISDLKKVFIHQANEKMDEAIVKRFYRLYKQPVPDHIMPMNIKHFGNSSVATIPTLFDMVRRGEVENHQISSGDLCLFASVGAGMNINAFTYLY